jgi:hypothetical protein
LKNISKEWGLEAGDAVSDGEVAWHMPGPGFDALQREKDEQVRERKRERRKG